MYVRIYLRIYLRMKIFMSIYVCMFVVMCLWTHPLYPPPWPDMRPQISSAPILWIKVYPWPKATPEQYPQYIHKYRYWYCSGQLHWHALNECFVRRAQTEKCSTLLPRVKSLQLGSVSASIKKYMKKLMLKFTN